MWNNPILDSEIKIAKNVDSIHNRFVIGIKSAKQLTNLRHFIRFMDHKVEDVNLINHWILPHLMPRSCCRMSVVQSISTLESFLKRILLYVSQKNYSPDQFSKIKNMIESSRSMNLKILNRRFFSEIEENINDYIPKFESLQAFIQLRHDASHWDYISKARSYTARNLWVNFEWENKISWAIDVKMADLCIELVYCSWRDLLQWVLQSKWMSDNLTIDEWNLFPQLPEWDISTRFSYKNNL